ncbi:MAG: hypothetical protein WD767_04900 [Alphaproteobacteria bacterium]
MESPFEAIQDSAGVVVVPIEGAPAAASGPLTEILAAALVRRGIPATTGGALKNGSLLEGLAASPGPAGDLLIDWNLTDESGASVTAFSTRHPVTQAAWQAGRVADLERIADATAAAIAESLRGPAMSVRDIPEKQRSRFAVVSVNGAPGDGNEALKTAFEAMLRRTGLPVTANPEEAAILIYGVVRVTPAADGRDSLSLVWTLRDPDGVEIGELKQSNQVRHGELDAKWGALAYDITAAVVSDVARIMTIIDDAEAVRRR